MSTRTLNTLNTAAPEPHENEPTKKETYIELLISAGCREVSELLNINIRLAYILDKLRGLSQETIEDETAPAPEDLCAKLDAQTKEKNALITSMNKLLSELEGFI